MRALYHDCAVALAYPHVCVHWHGYVGAAVCPPICAAVQDLADHPTVEYIAKLESYVQLYKGMYVDEREKAKGLKLALEAQKRLVQKHAAATVGGRCK